MKFAFTDDQLLFRDAVREFLAKECPPEAVRAAWDSGISHSSDLWSALAELGVIGLMVPEDAGGLGMNELDLVLLLEETGRAALPEPVVETAAVAPGLLIESDRGAADEWLARIAGGEAIVAVAMGNGLGLDADVADAIIVCRDDRVALVPTAAVTAEAQRSVDGARHLFAIEWDAASELVLAQDEAADRIGARAFDRGALATAAQLVGLADHLLAVTVAYVQEREQFGVPIGSFQAIKHHLADALLALEFAKPVVYNAAYGMANNPDTASRDVSMAKAAASDAATTVARHGLQCHGAIAYTVEYDLHMWMKRVWALAASWGSANWHRRRVAESVLGPNPAD